MEPIESNFRIALLDADFIIKTHIVSDKNRNILFQSLIKLEEYRFCCHEKVFNELKDNQKCNVAAENIRELISTGTIKCYTDLDIVLMLDDLFGDFGWMQYRTIFKRVCNISSDECFFKQYYDAIERLSADAGRDVFLSMLNECDAKIPDGNSVGEKKTFVLMQVLELITNKEVYMFCSDDRNARLSAVLLEDKVNCLSILGLFVTLIERGEDQNDLKAYYDSLCDYIKSVPNNQQTGFKVWKKVNNNVVRKVIGFEQIFTDIADKKFEIRVDGDISYR